MIRLSPGLDAGLAIGYAPAGAPVAGDDPEALADACAIPVTIDHVREPTPVDTRPTVGMNRDTLRGAVLADSGAGAAMTLPDGARACGGGGGCRPRAPPPARARDPRSVMGLPEGGGGAMIRRLLLATCAGLGLAGMAGAQPAQELDALAQDLANPIASLVSVPFQMNWDRNIGPRDDGDRLTTNIQPVIPVGLSDDWNLITRTILPVTWQEDVFPGAGSQFGLGDLSASLFLSPAQVTEGGFIWGAGPILVLPTATDDLLGVEKWAAGPTAVGLVQRGPWTVGALANHVWSFAGEDARAEVNRSFLQPFVSYTTDSAWTFSLQSESAYDWTARDWSVPVNVGASKLVLVGGLPVSLQAGAGYWATAPDGGPEGVRFRLQVTFLFPR